MLTLEGIEPNQLPDGIDNFYLAGLSIDSNASSSSVESVI
jgi:hypothetical protein